MGDRSERAALTRDEPARATLAPRLRLAALCLVALVALYRPIVSGLVYSLAPEAAFGLLLLLGALLWLSSELVEGRIRVRFGLPGALLSAFMAAALVSILLAENRFAGLKWWWLVATYGMTAFLVLQLAAAEQERRFLLGGVLATAAALGAYALWHRAFYMPALERWLAAEPAFFQGAVGATGPLAQDLRWRVATARAYGNFVTPNQLADFLVLTLFPLAGILARWPWRGDHAGGPVRTAAGGTVALALVALLSALALTGSKGGLIAFAFGAGVAAALALKGRARLVAGVAGALIALCLVAWWAGAVPAARRLTPSLAVRLGYWRTSLLMVRARPVLGVGPGAWPDWYAMLKAPEQEETRAAHSFYMQLWAETGSVGLALWLALWAAVLVPALRPGTRASPPKEQQAGAGDGGGRVPVLAGLVVAALAFAFDYAAVGSFLPPRYVAPWLSAAPWLPYAAMYLVWAGVFWALAGTPGRPEVPLWALAGGLAAFLLHSAGDFTLRVPAIGGTVSVLAALLVAVASLPRRREVRIEPRAAAFVFLGGALAVAGWAAGPMRRAVDSALSRETAGTLRAELAGGGRATPDQVADELRRACEAVPWEDESWRELAAWLTRSAARSPRQPAEARAAAERAVRLNPLAAANWAALGSARTMGGDAAGAAEAYRRAAEAYPSLPEAWYRYGRALEAAGRDARGEYRCALDLMPRQYHERNRVLGPPQELASFGADLPGAPPKDLLETAVGLAARAGAADVPPDARPVEKVRLLARGLPGAEDLVARWDSYDARTEEERFWELTAGRLWQWALEARLRSMPQPGPS